MNLPTKYTLKVWGDFACFTRPEMKVERVSYEVITPSAARAIFEAIFWSPLIEWNIEKIQVLNPIKWIQIRRNEIASKGSPQKTIYIEEERVQRASSCLKDVAYILTATMLVPSKDANLEKKFHSLFLRRVRKGQCFTQPYLGCREFPSYFELLEGKTPPPISQTEDLGWMLYDMDYQEKKITPLLFHAFMKQGEILIPSKKTLRTAS